MDIHKVIEGLKAIDAKIGTGQLTTWTSDSVYYELKKINENVVGNRTYYHYTRRNFDKNTILGNILSLVSSVDSNEFKKWKRSGFDIKHHQFKCTVEVKSNEYSEKAEYLGVEQELSEKTSHTVDKHHTLLDLVISSECDNLKKILLEKGAKVSPDPKYTGYMIASGIFTICATVAMACDQSKLTIIAGAFVIAVGLPIFCYSAYKHTNPDIAEAKEGPLNSLDNPKSSESKAPKREALAQG